MSVRVTFGPDGKVAAVDGAPEDAAAFIRALSAEAPPSRQNGRGQERRDEEPPSPEEIAAYIDSLPNGRHSMTNIVMHFAGQTIPSRVGEEQNPIYRRWVEASNRARTIVSEKRGAPFEVEQEGKKRTYYLKSHS